MSRPPNTYRHPARRILEDAIARKFPGETLQTLCRRTGVKTNVALARIKSGVPLNLALDPNYGKRESSQ